MKLQKQEPTSTESSIRNPTRTTSLIASRQQDQRQQRKTTTTKQEESTTPLSRSLNISFRQKEKRYLFPLYHNRSYNLSNVGAALRKEENER